MPTDAKPLSEEEIEGFRHQINSDLIRRFLATIDAMKAQAREHSECVGELEYAAENKTLRAKWLDALSRLAAAEKERDELFANFLVTKDRLAAAEKREGELDEVFPRWPDGERVSQMTFDILRDQLADAKKKNERLREALSSIAWPQPMTDCACRYAKDINCIHRIAAAALKEE